MNKQSSVNQTARSAAKSTRQSNKRRTRKSRNRNRGSPQPHLQLSPCATEYARVKINPFMEGNVAPCIPDLLDIPSYKLKVLTRGTFNVGTQGVGWLVINSENPGNTTVTMQYSNVSYNVTSSPLRVFTLQTGRVDGYESRYPYTAVDSPKYRVVASAVRVRYTGTELNRGGQIITWANNNPTPTNPVGNVTFAAPTDIAAKPDAKIYPCNRSWITLAWSSTDPDAYGYQKSGGLGLFDYPNTATMFVCVTGTPQNSFEFERVSYYELISDGPTIVPDVTKSHSDPVGYGVVRDFIAENYTTYGEQAWNAFKSYALNAAMNSLTGLSTVTSASSALTWRSQL